MIVWRKNKNVGRLYLYRVCKEGIIPNLYEIERQFFLEVIYTLYRYFR